MIQTSTHLNQTDVVSRCNAIVSGLESFYFASLRFWKKDRTQKGGLISSNQTGLTYDRGLGMLKLSLRCLEHVRQMEISVRLAAGRGQGLYEMPLQSEMQVMAKASLFCEDFSAAQLYLDCWIRGTETLGSETQQQDFDEAPEYNSLLLSVQQKMDDPDGVYGISRNNSLLSQVCLLFILFHFLTFPSY
jgi:hypothetical protein